VHVLLRAEYLMLLEQPLAVSELHVGSFKTNRLVSDQSSRQCPCNSLNPHSQHAAPKRNSDIWVLSNVRSRQGCWIVCNDAQEGCKTSARNPLPRIQASRQTNHQAGRFVVGSNSLRLGLAKQSIYLLRSSSSAWCLAVTWEILSCISAWNSL